MKAIKIILGFISGIGSVYLWFFAMSRLLPWSLSLEGWFGLPTFVMGMFGLAAALVIANVSINFCLGNLD